MNLPEDDEMFLKGKGFEWSLIPDGNGGFLIIKAFAVNGEKFGRESTDLMVRIPPQYNMAKLDMWYVDPPLRLRGSNQFPNRATHFESYAERSWQRFSRHLPDGAWRAGVDGLPMFFTFINSELR